MSLFVPEIAVWEKVLRSVVVYAFMLLAFRFTGKRQVGQLTPFDLVVLLITARMSEKPNIGREAARIETDALTIEIWRKTSAKSK